MNEGLAEAAGPHVGKKLHRWVYAAGLLAVVHYLWVSKVAFGKPVIYAGILALLLATASRWCGAGWCRRVIGCRAHDLPGAACAPPGEGAEYAVTCGFLKKNFSMARSRVRDRAVAWQGVSIWGAAQPML